MIPHHIDTTQVSSSIVEPSQYGTGTALAAFSGKHSVTSCPLITDSIETVWASFGRAADAALAYHP